MSDNLAKPEGLSLDRRAFVTTATGYALAVSPVTAWAITTPAGDLVTADVMIPVGKESMPAYVARPKKGGPAPCVLVIQEIFGIHEYIKDVCRRLAHEGYYAIAPSLYFRYGDATKIDNIDKLRADIVSKVKIDDVMKDLDATAAWAATQKEADASVLAITGFCWGGGVTWMYAAHNPKLKAAVAWYGRLSGEASPIQTKFPLDVAGDLKAPVLGLYGEKDKGIPLDQVEKMRAALSKNKSPAHIIVYDGADHGFHADYRPSYNEKAAKAGWSEMLAWFRKHGVK